MTHYWKAAPPPGPHATPVYELALDTGIEAIFDVPEVLLTGMEGPMDVTLSTLNAPDEPFAGRVSEVSPLVSPQTGTVTVKVAIDAPPDGLDLGQAVRGTVSFEGQDPVVELPWTAISAQGDAPAVWRITDAGTAELVPVTVDGFATKRVFVSDGIKAGDRIVGKGAQLLFPGRQIVDVTTLAAGAGE